jgi:N-acetylneuraminic acid mutarotase
VNKGKMYLFGGSNSMTNNAKLYSLDLKSLSWSIVPQLAAEGDDSNIPEALDEHSAIIHDEKMYIFGGFVNGERDNRIFAFDFASNRW